MEHEAHLVYMLKCRDGTFYTGYTNDVEARLKAHNSGKGAKYTRGRGPCRVVHLEEYPTKSLALKREHEIKQLSRKQKAQLIQQNLEEANNANPEKF